MPSVSKKQQAFMGAALARKKAGHPAPYDPKMSMGSLEDFAATKTKGLPAKVKIKKSNFGGK